MGLEESISTELEDHFPDVYLHSTDIINNILIINIEMEYFDTISSTDSVGLTMLDEDLFEIGLHLSDLISTITEFKVRHVDTNRFSPLLGGTCPIFG